MRRFKKILFVDDGDSNVARATLELSLELAKRNDGQVDLLKVVDVPPAMFVSNTAILLQPRLIEAAKQELKDLKKSVAPGGDLKIKIVEGRSHIQIVREVIRGGYDLVVKPIGPSGFVDRLLGRVDMRLLRHCPCPVWLSKGETYGAFDTVLAAVDGGEPENQATENAVNRQIMEMAFSLCADIQAELHVGHAWYPQYMVSYSRARRRIPKATLDAYLNDEKKFHKNWLTQLMRKSKKWVGADTYAKVKRHTHLRHGIAEEEIPNLIKRHRADLVIMGTVARTGISGLVMGNTAEEILDRVTSSVLAVKPPGFVSQVKLDD